MVLTVPPLIQYEKIYQSNGVLPLLLQSKGAQIPSFEQRTKKSQVGAGKFELGVLTKNNNVTGVYNVSGSLIKAGSLIEYGIVRRVPVSQNSAAQKGLCEESEFVLNWQENAAEGPASSGVTCGGLAMFYGVNSKPGSFNTKMVKFIEEDRYEIYAVKDIHVGEELTRQSSWSSSSPNYITPSMVSNGSISNGVGNNMPRKNNLLLDVVGNNNVVNGAIANGTSSSNGHHIVSSSHPPSPISSKTKDFHSSSNAVDTAGLTPDGLSFSFGRVLNNLVNGHKEANSYQNNLAFFNGWCKTGCYDEDMKEKWGYVCDERLAKMVVDQNLGGGGNMRILDVGCGTGLCGEAVLNYYEKSWKKQIMGKPRLVGMDCCQEALNVIQKKNSGSNNQIYDEVILGNLEELAGLREMKKFWHPACLESNSFDVIIAGNVLSYLSNYEAIFREWIRLLKGSKLNGETDSSLISKKKNSTTKFKGRVYFSHQVPHWDRGEKKQGIRGEAAAAQKLEDEGLWKLVERRSSCTTSSGSSSELNCTKSGKFLYLPGHPEETMREVCMEYFVFEVL